MIVTEMSNQSWQQRSRNAAAAALELSSVSAAVSRREARLRAARLRRRSFIIIQLSLAAGIAYFLAKWVFRVQIPLFAPAAAIMILGLTYGQRLRRTIEITIGVAVGVGVGELFVYFLGIGVWQVGLIVLISVGLATLLGGGVHIATQAGQQGLIVAMLAGSPDTAFGRWYETLIGSVAALLFATIVPRSDIIRPRYDAAGVLNTLSAMLHDTSAALARSDKEAIDAILERSAGTERQVEELRNNANDSVDAIRFSPFHRKSRTDVLKTRDQVEVIDRCITNVRVLVRRASIALQFRERVPPSYIGDIGDLSESVEKIADDVSESDMSEALRRSLIKVARDTRNSDPAASLSAEVIRAQIRSIVVDLLILTGVSRLDAQRALRSSDDPSRGSHDAVSVR